MALSYLYPQYYESPYRVSQGLELYQNSVACLALRILKTLHPTRKLEAPTFDVHLGLQAIFAFVQ